MKPSTGEVRARRSTPDTPEARVAHGTEVESDRPTVCEDGE